MFQKVLFVIKFVYEGTAALKVKPWYAISEVIVPIFFATVAGDSAYQSDNRRHLNINQ
jgi:hypothetical protein